MPEPPPPVDPELVNLAVDLAHRAGELTLGLFGTGGLVVERKDDGSPVTVADRDAERLLREELAGRFPDDGVLGEEEPETPGTSGRRWVIDPIDGTIAFTRGVPLYSNLLALQDDHGVAVGVVNLPALGETVYAGRGVGCFRNGAPARVSDTTEVAGAYLTTSDYAAWPDAHLAAVKDARLALRAWGDGYGYALVATGRADVMYDPIAAPYDLGPMPVLLAEAGGRFTDGGGTVRIDGGTGLATNGHLHDRLLSLLA